MSAARPRSNALPAPRMLKKGIKVKDAVEVFDKTFKFCGQQPPIMKAHMKDPTSSFMIDAYSLISRWPDGVMLRLLKRLTNIQVPTDTAGLLGRTKALLHEVLGDESTDSRNFFSKWKLWPHRQIDPREDVDSTDSKELTEEERRTMSKQAVKKKVTAKKGASAKKTVKAAGASAKKTTRANGGKRVNGDTKLKKVKNFDSGVRAEMTALIPAGGITFSSLVATAKKKHGWDEKKVKALTGWLRSNKFIEAAH